ncbi:MAG: tRNA (N6-isopentenyl adenosine(37)-C2)-methylthiotransferase MiaB [Clostridia bacterium]|nr:tRNA (N6-isopentenyl adenosine(37)-C2)-methylthiotransferase MiaB [Clostridia bacterium]
MGKYLINTYGCQMNIHESEKVAGILQDYGFEETTEVNDADVIVFNTCCIREGAETKIFSNIGAVKPLKKKNKNLIVAVLGCMTQQKKTAENLKKKFPWIDIIIGTFNSDEFEKYFKKSFEEKQKSFEVFDKEFDIVENTKFFRTSGDNAWVNITYGCNNFCTYCIVPYVRGRERSRRSENIIKECENLVKEGYKQITLLGQNVNSYGNDREDEISFPMLCKKICQIEGDFRLKFMTSHPKDFSSELIDVIASEEKMSKVVHLPCQSGSNKILKLMNRSYTRENYLQRIEELKSKIPYVSLTSDFIVGFPYEEEEDFEQTKDLVEKVQYNSIFAFMYSKRSGTVAEKMENQVDLQVKRRRVNELLALQKEITAKKNEKLVGFVFDCLLQEKKDKKIMVSESGLSISLESYDGIEFSKYYKVAVTSVKGNKISGKIEKRK